MQLRAVIFDVDGTLVDSQAHILSSMQQAFARQGLEPPSRERVLGIVGLSLDIAIAQLAPHVDEALWPGLVQGYKDAYMSQRLEQGARESSPFYPGAREALEALRARDEVLLGVATGKSRRGLNALVDGHGLEGMFLTQQVADDHPSKPAPAMLEQAMHELGVDPRQTVMIGDTVFDMQMARNAGTHFIGVAWGYHAAERLTDAAAVITSFDQLPAALETIWREYDV